MHTKYILLWFMFISAVGIVMTVYDKIAAKQKKRRVRERTLLLIGFLDAALPMFLTMHIIRHKTRHKKFMIGLPVCFLLHGALIVCYLLIL